MHTSTRRRTDLSCLVLATDSLERLQELPAYVAGEDKGRQRERWDYAYVSTWSLVFLPAITSGCFDVLNLPFKSLVSRDPDLSVSII